MANGVAFRCQNCGKSSTIMEGDIMRAIFLRCDTCGMAKYVSYEDLKIANVDWNDINAVVRFAGVCGCGGHFDKNAPLRCPKCKSKNVKLNWLQPSGIID